MTHNITFKEIRSPEMENRTCHNPACAGIVFVIVFMFVYFCKDGLIAFTGWKSIDVHESELTAAGKLSNDIEHQQQQQQQYHLPYAVHDQDTLKPLKSLHPYNLSDSTFFSKMQQATKT